MTDGAFLSWRVNERVGRTTRNTGIRWGVQEQRTAARQAICAQRAITCRAGSIAVEALSWRIDEILICVASTHASSRRWLEEQWQRARQTVRGENSVARRTSRVASWTLIIGSVLEELAWAGCYAPAVREVEIGTAWASQALLRIRARASSAWQIAGGARVEGSIGILIGVASSHTSTQARLVVSR